MNSSTLRYDFKLIRERDVQSIFEKNYRSLFKRIQNSTIFSRIAVFSSLYIVRFSLIPV